MHVQLVYHRNGTYLISSIVAFFISRRSLKPLQRFSKQLEKIQMKNLDDTRVEEGEVAETGDVKQITE